MFGVYPIFVHVSHFILFIMAVRTFLHFLSVCVHLSDYVCCSFMFGFVYKHFQINSGKALHLFITVYFRIQYLNPTEMSVSIKSHCKNIVESLFALRTSVQIYSTK